MEIELVDMATVAREEPETAAYFTQLAKMTPEARAAKAQQLMKADMGKAVIDTTAPATAAQQLNAFQSRSYFVEPRCGAPTLEMADVAGIGGPQDDTDRMALPRRRTMAILPGAAEQTAPTVLELNRPTFTQVTINPKEFVYPARVGRRFLATNLERNRFLDSFLKAAQPAVLSDAEEIAYQSVAGQATPAAWNTNALTAINGLHQGLTNCASVSAATAEITLRHLILMVNALPGQAQQDIHKQKAGYVLDYDFDGDQGGLGPWVYMFPNELVNAIWQRIGTRLTGWGDQVYKEGGMLFFGGIPIIGTCGIPTDLAGTGASSGHTDEDLTYGVLYQARNVKFRFMTHPGETEDRYGLAAWTHPQEEGLYRFAAIFTSWDLTWVLPSHVCFLTNAAATIPL